ncbi:mitochondrial processing peptidase [Rickenella mellea]|uniref:Alpha-MPP n=1 Tax=Rickenella mellea TaxID=50990 RepID=A0A4Y7PZY7_9AGAM|nr:mitochondrial processing peptidase [Rickenella mellea]
MRRNAISLARRGFHKRSVHIPQPQNPPVQITTLPNNIRVATESTPGHFSAVGLYVDAGSRYETPSTSGVSHFLDRMAFKSTRTRTDEEMSTAIHALGGQIQCSSSREAIMYQSSHFHQATPQALAVISDTVLNPAFLPEELAAQREAARYEIREINAKPEMILPEVLHQVAYGNETLGNPLLCPEDRIDAIDEGIMRGFMKTWYAPERIVVAGAGMVHEELVELTDKYFSSLKSGTLHTPQIHTQPSTSRPNSVPPHLLPSNTQSPSVIKSLTRAASYLYPNTPTSPSDGPLLPASSYTGGHRFIHNPQSEFNHIYIGFEGVGIHDPDIYTLATIQILLGGGGSFSAGGPGKGMYSRLYTHILNHHPQIDHCESFHHIYTDSSLFGIFASFVPAGTSVTGFGRRQGNSPEQIMAHLVHQFSLLLHANVDAKELLKAKNQLKSSLVMALESRAVEVEDLGRQVLVHNRKIPVTEMCDHIDEVTPDDVRRVAQRVFGTQSAKKATVVTMGREDVGDWQAVLRKYAVGGGKGISM